MNLRIGIRTEVVKVTVIVYHLGNKVEQIKLLYLHLTCEVPFFLKSVGHQSTRTKGSTRRGEFCMACEHEGNNLPGEASVRRLSFIPEYRGNTGLGTVAGKSPNLHEVALSYHLAGLAAAQPYQNS